MGGNVADDKSFGADNGAIADANPVHHGAGLAQPHLVPNQNGFAVLIALPVDVMRSIVIADGDVAPDFHILSERDVISANHRESDIGGDTAFKGQRSPGEYLNFGTIADIGFRPQGKGPARGDALPYGAGHSRGV